MVPGGMRILSKGSCFLNTYYSPFPLAQIQPSAALAKVEEYLSEIKKLEKLKYSEGNEKRYLLNSKIRSLVGLAFDDGSRKIKEYDSEVNFFFVVAGREEPAEEKQQDYLSRLASMKKFLLTYKEELELVMPTPAAGVSAKQVASPSSSGKKTVFIVHGHDELNLLRLEKLLRDRWNLHVVVLKDKPGKGRTVIEKFEQEAQEVSYAFVFLTAEDKITVGEDQSYTQARPNALFELGWFYGHHGRERVCILFKKGGKIHSDLDGINRIDFKDNIEEKIGDVEAELRAAGLI